VPEFTYTALDAGGRKRKGKAQSANEVEAIRQIKALGLTPVQLHAQSSFSLLSLPSSKPSEIEIAGFMEELASLIGAQLPLDEALEITAQSRQSALAKRITTMREALRAGLPFSVAVEQQGTLFHPIVQALVAAGERSGSLAEVLQRLAADTRRSLELRQKLQAALVYPAILTVASLVTMAGLVLFLVPRLAPILEQANKEPPVLISAALAINHFLSANGLLIAAVLFLASLALASRWNEPRFRLLREGLWLKLPIAESMITARETITVAGVLSLVTGGGVPLVEAMPLAAKAAKSLTTRAQVHKAETILRAGESFLAASEQSGLFTPQTRSLIAAGERSGRLAAMLDYIAKTESNRLAAKAETLTASLGPVITLIIGVVVGSLAWSVMDALMSMNEIVQ
jgi:general secretion pathway protein F